MSNILANTLEKSKSMTSVTAVLRVAAYILLSQETSYEAGLAHFNQIIQTTPNYTSAGIYSDYASMLSASRTNYERLLKDCREGRIDRILCRSVSDFAQDEAQFLETLNMLKGCHVTVFFEEEDLDTANPAAMLTLSGLAEFHREERRGVSASFREVRRKQRAGGVTANRAIYGYRYADGADAYETTEDGYARRKVVIVEEEAMVVRRIFRLVADGKSYGEVARILNEEGVPAPQKRKSDSKEGSVNTRIRSGTASSGNEPEITGGRAKAPIGGVGWTAQRIGQMVRLERYMGDALLLKSYIIPGEAGKRVMNRGELPQEYVEGNHPAIVSRELFEAAQRPQRKDPVKKNKSRDKTPPALSGKIICAECGRYYHITNRKTSPIWVCPSARLHNGIEICSAVSVREEQLLDTLKKALVVRFAGNGDGEGKVETNAAGNVTENVEENRERSEGNLVRQLMALLEKYRNFDDRERADFERALEEIRDQNKRIQSSIRMTQARLDAQKVRLEVLGEEDPEEDTIRTLMAQMEDLKEEGRQLSQKETLILRQIEARKLYWAELAKGAAAREKTLCRLCELSRAENLREEMNGERLEEMSDKCQEKMNIECLKEINNECQEEMNDECQEEMNGECQEEMNGECQEEMNGECLSELNDECLASLIISVTIYKDHVAVRWLDDSVTDLMRD